MPYVRITRDVLLTRAKSRLVFHKAGWRGPVPQAQADEIEARNAGIALTKRGDGPKTSAELDAIEARLKAG